MNSYWISFVEGDDEDTAVHHGCCVVEAHTAEGAVQACYDLGIYPGDSHAMLIEMPPCPKNMPEFPRNRILSHEELENAGWGRNWDELTEEEKRNVENAEEVTLNKDNYREN